MSLTFCLLCEWISIEWYHICIHSSTRRLSSAPKSKRLCSLTVTSPAWSAMVSSTFITGFIFYNDYSSWIPVEFLHLKYCTISNASFLFGFSLTAVFPYHSLYPSIFSPPITNLGPLFLSHISLPSHCLSITCLPLLSLSLPPSLSLSTRFLHLCGGGRRRAAALYHWCEGGRISICQRYITSPTCLISLFLRTYFLRLSLSLSLSLFLPLSV